MRTALMAALAIAAAVMLVLSLFVRVELTEINDKNVELSDRHRVFMKKTAVCALSMSFRRILMHSKRMQNRDLACRVSFSAAPRLLTLHPKIEHT